jgi:hypothetical protein
MLGKAGKEGLALDEDVLRSRPLAPSSIGKMHDSKTGLYKLTKGIDRPIGVGGTQSVHPTAIERWDKDRGYRPKNLRDYLKAVGDARHAAP